MTYATIALGIPHTPWVPERARSMDRLRQTVVQGPEGCNEYRQFTERAPNAVWCEQLWKWLAETGADWCLQLQDDVMVAPCFWPALRAMLGALPEDAMVVGLTSVHPMGKEIERRGHRWYRTPGNLVGWAYALRHEAILGFLSDRAKADDKFRAMNEDEQIARWCQLGRIDVWHPVPTIVDHDTTIPSSYKNDAHSHRRPPVTWRDYGEGSLTDASWWAPSGMPEMLPIPMQRVCGGCGTRQEQFRFPTGIGLCGICIGAVMGTAVGNILQGGRSQ